MPKFYVVKGIGGGFDGLLVEGEEGSIEHFLVKVAKLTDRGSIIGDRNVSLPIPEGALFFDRQYLEEIEDPGIREFASDNPFGRQVATGNMEMGDLVVSYAEFEKALSVNVYDVIAAKTLFSQYFMKDFQRVKDTIVQVLKAGDGSNSEDLVFKLQELKGAETNGQA